MNFLTTKIEQAREFLTGKKKENYLPFLYEIDEKENLQDESSWEKENPYLKK